MTETADGQPDDLGGGALRERAAAELLAARERTTVLTSAVDEADLVKQHSPLMSPLALVEASDSGMSWMS